MERDSKLKVVVVGLLLFLVSQRRKEAGEHQKEHEVDSTAEEPPVNNVEEDEGFIDKDVYFDHRRLLFDTRVQSTQNLDKYLITLSAGALGLSLAFIRRIAPDPTLLWSIKVAWSGFGFSLVFVLASFWLSQVSLRKAVDLLDHQYRTGDQKNNSWDTAIKILNFSSMLFFIISVAFLTYFAIGNLN